MGEVTQARGPVDSRTGIVALVSQPHFPGVNTDAQPERGQRRPLQVQRGGRRIRRAAERDHKAVALALLDRTHSVMGHDHFGQHLIEALDRSVHFLRLGLPQSC